MRKALFASAFLLLLAMSASAADLMTPAASAPASDIAQGVFMPKPTPAAACTVSCYFDPSISCTSQSGNCYHPTIKGLEWISCDGHSQVCPGL